MKRACTCAGDGEVIEGSVMVCWCGVGVCVCVLLCVLLCVDM